MTEAENIISHITDALLYLQTILLLQICCACCTRSVVDCAAVSHYAIKVFTFTQAEGVEGVRTVDFGKSHVVKQTKH